MIVMWNGTFSRSWSDIEETVKRKHEKWPDRKDK